MLIDLTNIANSEEKIIHAEVPYKPEVFSSALGNFLSWARRRFRWRSGIKGTGNCRLQEDVIRGGHPMQPLS